MSIFTVPLRNTTFTRKPGVAAADQSTKDTDIPSVDCSNIDPESDADRDEEREVSEDESEVDEEAAIRLQSIQGTARTSRQAGKHRSLRYQHIDVLVTLIHASILDSDWSRAERAYALLLRCKGIDIRLCYDLGLEILNHTDPTGRRSAELLSRLIIAYPPLKARHGKRSFDRADKFVKLLVEHRIHHKQFKISMQELDGWLLVPPYKDDRQLWSYLANVCEELEEEAHANNNHDVVKIMKNKRKRALAKASGDEPMDSSDWN